MTQPASKRLVTEDVFTTGQAAKQPTQKVAATVTANSTAVVNKLNQVDATGGVRTLTLPTGQPEGTLVGAEKMDPSTNAVNVTGDIRGVAATTIALSTQNEARLFLADSAGSWHPIADHRTKTALDAAYKPALTNAPAGSRFDAPLDGTVTTNVNLARPSSRTDIFFTWNSTVQPANMIAGDKWDKQVP